MRSMRYLALALTALAVFATLPADAKVNGVMVGRVTISGTPVQGVTVTISGPAMMGKRSMTTNPDGRYRFAAVPPGDYTVKFEFAQQRTRMKPASVLLSMTSRVDVDLNDCNDCNEPVSERMTRTRQAPRMTSSSSTIALME